MKILYKLFRLRWKERSLLIYTFAVMSFIRLGLRFLSFRSLWEWVEKLSQLRLLRLQDRSVQKILWAVEVSSFYMPGQVLCLARALTTQIVMRQFGFSPELRIGVAKGEGGNLDAHAWIEYEGKVAIGHLADLSRYVLLPSLKGLRV
jgi:hypothetical protein